MRQRSALTVGGGAERELRVVLVGEPLDEVDLLERQLHGVAVLRVARHVRRPELLHDTQLIKYHARLRAAPLPEYQISTHWEN